MGKKKRSDQLSHEEIWDDSALVRSWDEAVEEYKVYHSIHARGEDVEQVLNRAEEEGLDKPMDTETGAVDATKSSSDDKAPLSEGQETQQPTTSYSQLPAGAPAMPSALLGQVQDPALKNLMMSWYFAGYYTGLYEGQQQRQQQASQNTTTP